MALKPPLVITAGLKQQLQAGDTLDAPLFNLGSLILASFNAPNLAATPQNNYAPVGLPDNITVIRLMVTIANVSITGFNAGASGQVNGRVIIFLNRNSSGGNATFEHQNGGSTPTNRFVNGFTGGPRVVGPGGMIGYYYDVGGTPRWNELFASL